MFKRMFKGKTAEKKSKRDKDNASDVTTAIKFGQDTEQNYSIVVVAIDFGTTFSGWAYSFRHDYERNPIEIYSKMWNGGTYLSQKAPTCILIKPDGKTIDSFGYEAEMRYSEKAANEEQAKWFYFQRFKMKLFKDKGTERNSLLEDECGKKLSAMTVFSLSIEYLKKDVINNLDKKVLRDFGISDISWILTVPAIWNDAAKQFMREAAQKAGIPGNKLTICLEPEAASIYCRHLPVSKSSSDGEKTSLSQFSSGTKYMVLDAGGGTVDITVHEVTERGELKELHKASGGAWGGTKVDQAYEAFLTSIAGSDVIKTFKNQHMDDGIEIYRDFEIKKRSISPAKQEAVTFRIPANLFTLCIEKRRRNLKDLVLESRYSGKVKVMNDKLRVEADVMREFFKPTVQSIMEHVTSLLNESSVVGCAAILMVGGFSESQMLQESILVNFPNLRIIVPNDAGLAVLKGAVIFGHEPTAITERVCKYTYGVMATHKYKESCNHPRGRVEIDENGDMRCFDIFNIHVEAGESVKLDEEQKERIGTPVTDDQDAITRVIYSSTKPSPYLVTEEGCNRIGHFKTPITDKRMGRNHQFGTSFIFGGTEIVVKVVDKETGDVTYESVDFLG